MDQGEDVVEAYRRTEQRLRLMLLGDGTNEPGMVRGEEQRTRASAALRRMRDLFTQAVGVGAEGTAASEARMSRLEEELHRIAAGAASGGDAPERLLTPAEAADELGVSVSSVYRAVRSDRIRGLRATNRRNGALRIPASEVARVRGASRGSS